MDYANGVFDNQEDMGQQSLPAENTNAGRNLLSNQYVGRMVPRNTPRKVWQHLDNITNAQGNRLLINPYLTETYNSKPRDEREDGQGNEYMPGVIHHWR